MLVSWNRSGRSKITVNRNSNPTIDLNGSLVFVQSPSTCDYGCTMSSLATLTLSEALRNRFQPILVEPVPSTILHVMEMSGMWSIDSPFCPLLSLARGGGGGAGGPRGVAVSRLLSPIKTLSPSSVYK